MRPALTAVAGLSVGFLAGCPSRSETAANDAVVARESVRRIPVGVRPNVDLLFVMDNSVATVEAQYRLISRIYPVLDSLTGHGGALPNLHIGVVTTDMGTLGVETGDSLCTALGDEGRLTNNGCAVDGTFARAVDTDGDGAYDDTNFANTIEDTFACMAAIRTDGCGLEQPLESMRQALDAQLARNPGFLRDDAQLVVVVLADEDDCSAYNPAFYTGETSTLGFLDSFRCFEYGVRCDEDAVDERAVGPRTNCTSDEDSAYLRSIATYADFLRGLKPDPNDVMLAVIAGAPAPVAVGQRTPSGTNQLRPDLSPSCMYEGGGSPDAADPAIRLHALTEAVPVSSFTSLCDGDIDSALAPLAALPQNPLGSPCMVGPLVDGDANLDGVQPVCVVADVIDPDGAAIETPLPACNGDQPSNLPCVRFAHTPEICPPAFYPTQLSIDVVRATLPPPGTVIVARCEA